MTTKHFFLLIGFVWLYDTESTAQHFRELTPARGHYRDLQKFSPVPRVEREEIDQQKFPYDKSSAERRLSLKPYYLENFTPDDFRIPDPPANSSETTRAEINYLLTLQQQRTDDDVRASLHMAGVFYSPRLMPGDEGFDEVQKNLFFIGRSIGTWFNPKELPVTAQFMANVWRDASYFIWSFKYMYLRVRPYILDPSVQNLEDANWAAYPSGHAANSYINAFIYQELAPEFSDVFLKDAYDMAHSREILGVHYPSDSEASRIFARQFVNALFQNEKFLQDIEKVRLEWSNKAKESFEKPSGGLTELRRTAPSCAK
jgi:acid phosphatase (class A)